MKRRLLPILFFCASWGMHTAHGQTTLQQESFETNGEGTRYTSTTFDLRDAPNSSRAQYFLRENNPVQSASGSQTFGTNASHCDPTGANGTWFWASEGARGQTVATPDRPAQTVMLNTVTVTGYTALQVKVLMADSRGPGSPLASPNWETTDFIRVKARLDGGAWTTIGQFVGDNAGGGQTTGNLRQDLLPFNNISSNNVAAPIIGFAMQDFTFNVTGSGTTLQVMVEVDQIGGAEEFAFDNIRVVGTASATAAPVLAGIETTNLTYTEGQASPINISGTLTVSDADNTTLSGATVSISNGFIAGQDQLLFTNQNGITGTGSGTSSITLSGTATLAAYQAALRSVKYQNVETVNATGGTRLVSFLVSDGSNTSNTPSRSIDFIAHLNAPASLTNSYIEEFATNGEGTRYASNSFTVAAPCFAFARATTNPYACSPTTFGNVSGTEYWYAEGTSTLTNPNPVSIGKLVLAPVNATNYGNLHFNIRLATGQSAQWENDDFAKFYYRVNGGSWVLFDAFYGNATLNGELQRDDNADGIVDVSGTVLNSTLQNIDMALPAAVTGAAVDFMIEISNDGQEELAFDRIQISGTQLVAPTVTTTSPATSITPTTATVSGTLTASGGANVSDYGVVYVAGTGTPTTSNSKMQVGTNTPGTLPNNFTANLTGLTAGTQYTARAYATNIAGTSYGSNVTFTTATTVTSIVRTGTNPTNASTAGFTVTFANSVTGVSVSNFNITTTGTMSGGSIGSVSGSGTTWNVTVNTGLGSGTLRLNLANTTGISPSVSNVPFNGETYNIDKTAPAVTISSTASSPTSTSPIPVTVTFSEAVTGFVTGDVTVTNSTITGISGSGTTYNLSIAPNATGTVTVSVPASVAQDAAGNGNTAATQFPIQYNQPQTAAPVLLAPGNGSFVSTTTPTHSGTATAGSTVTVYVDGTSIGTTTTGGTGNWVFTQPTALSQGSHTVYATAQSSGATGSANSNTNTFTVQTPATYTSSAADQASTALAAAGTSNQAILRVAIVVGGGTGSPLSVTSFSFNTAGSTNATADIDAARLYYTGTSSTFATTNPFGNIASPNGAFPIPGTQQLVNGINYFFLVYDLDTNATTGNLLDATVASLTVGGIARTPTVTNPTGSRKIITTSRVAGGTLRNSATNSVSTGNTTVSYIDFSASPLPVLGPQYSQEVWIKPAFPNPQVAGLTYYVMGNGTNASPTAAPAVYVSSTGQVFAGFGTGSTFRSTSGTGANILNNGMWNYVVATYDGTTMRIYVNGEIQSNSAPTGSGTPLNTAAVTYIGNATTTGSNFFPGDIDEVSLWNRELSQTEIRLRRHLVRNGTENGLLAYLQFNESGTTSTDIVSGSVGTFTGSGSTRAVSTAAVGSGTSNLQTTTANTPYNFTGTNTSIVFTGVTGSSETVVSRLEGRPLGTQPGIRTFGEAYWIVDKYIGGTFTMANVTYTLVPNQSISTADAATPSNLKLFKRGGNDDGAFDAPIAASAASAAAGTVTFPVTSFSQMVIGSIGSSPLPVGLIAFKAVQEGSAALLRWTTAQEENSDRFEVEVSVDGLRFEVIGTVAGQGSTNSSTDYRFEDKQLLNYGAQRVYYRLRQLDWNGTTSYSSVRSITLSVKPAQGLTLVPNPGHTTTLTGAQAGATVVVYDALGRRALVTPADINGQAQLVLPAGFSSGIYLVRSGDRTARWAVE